MISQKDIDILIKQAEEVSKNAYAPYSGFTVGAALMTKSGRVFTGCNVENSSYGLTICAERSAVFSAVAAGEREFSALVIFTDTREPVQPCGACMQVLSEFCNDLKIIITTPVITKEEMLSDIFPEGFKGIGK